MRMGTGADADGAAPYAASSRLGQSAASGRGGGSPGVGAGSHVGGASLYAASGQSGQLGLSGSPGLSGPAGPQGGGRTGWGPRQGDRGMHVPRPPASLARRLAAPAAALASVAAAFAYVGSVDPNEPGHYPACPLLTYTGLLCPGCGGLRSAHAFIHGDLPTALGANAPAVVGYGVFAVVWTLWLIRSVQGRDLRVSLAAGWWWTLGGVLLVFSVVRNLPFGTALAP
ncbi:DUF2752 domain-containing protein [Streptomyces sp. PR69]|uniref:DUF2752 domain-containing protein n=1 Tax=Streptomyces sp. PR69 TaxID=2984950 RepID=UPI003A5BDC89